ncbi:response regulator transcription factor [Gracilibacillus sp. S3-1-1]|uniref:Response regulator transcription factor n=1 Tax=Gracilibacillus pellucidus TaxID=3095368 RepID=A0ACC6M761_9BACI|nr:response regulator transcription factor [Gracilibacillus sp. S3-1-1]MDX8046760.1 response regulator transcription factor [Gracilibacillus sp. S3-1-1]
MAIEDILKRLNIFVLEDDPDISKFLNLFLSDYFNKVTVKTDNRFNYSDFENIDIFLLDIEIPFDSGYEVCKRIKTVYPNKPVVFLTAHSQLDDKIKGLELGDDFIPKPFEPLELIARLKNLLKDRYGELVYLDDIIIDKRAHLISDSVTGTRIPLSETENKIFFYLYDNINVSLSREQIINHVWGIERRSSQANSLNVYINSLRNKVDMEGKLIQTIYGYGYKLSNVKE